MAICTSDAYHETVFAFVTQVVLARTNRRLGSFVGGTMCGMESRHPVIPDVLWRAPLKDNHIPLRRMEADISHASGRLPTQHHYLSVFN